MEIRLFVAVFIPQPRWCHKPWKGLLTQLVKRVNGVGSNLFINVVAEMNTPSVYCMVSWGVMINSQQLPNARKFLSLIFWNYLVYNLKSGGSMTVRCLDIFKANVTYLSTAVTLYARGFQAGGVNHLKAWWEEMVKIFNNLFMLSFSNMI